MAVPGVTRTRFHVDAFRAGLVACVPVKTPMPQLVKRPSHTLYFVGLPLTCPDLDPMTRTALANFALLAVCLSPNAFAADEPKGDLQAGKALVYTCGGCHGVTGYRNAYPNYHVPRIGGQNYDYLVSALNEYKKGERAHPTMRAQGESMSDEDIRNIAAYLSSITP